MRRLAFILGIFTSCAGCGSDGGVDVSGVVTLDGQPLPGVHITFDQPELSPNENIGYVGRTDAEGRYTLRPILGEGSGVPPGKYRVSLTTAVADPSAPPPPPPAGRRATIYDESPKPPPEKIPPKHRVQEFAVPADGTEEANFAITTK
ncbi:MAG TPA: carboxypeptidase-like regulatory domain-containing protein [Lacipirellulaceae bacterium]|nr:carboxypeptidase-like regulatory domain-containing protein [Lacipirellulaceae bacterium]